MNVESDAERSAPITTASNDRYRDPPNQIGGAEIGIEAAVPSNPAEEHGNIGVDPRPGSLALDNPPPDLFDRGSQDWKTRPFYPSMLWLNFTSVFSLILICVFGVILLYYTSKGPDPAYQVTVQTIIAKQILESLGIEIPKSSDECNYEGITCGVSGEVKEIDLSNRNLTGRIPQLIGRLYKLNTLKLGNNTLTGTVPSEIGGLESLQYLDLGGNNLTGKLPDQLGYLDLLEYVDVSENDLTGFLKLACSAKILYDVGEVSRSCTEAPSLSPSLSLAPTYTHIIWEQRGQDIDGPLELEMGWEVVLSHNGDTLAVAGAGYVNVYRFIADDNSWMMERQFLIEKLDYSLALSPDGSNLIIGDPPLPESDLIGTILVLRYNEQDSSWNQVGSPIYGEEGDQGGYYVDISGDGTRIAAGTTWSDYVKVFDLVNGEWRVKNKFTGAAGTYFGCQVAITLDGMRIAVGAYKASYNGAYSGSIFFYDLTSLSRIHFDRINGGVEEDWFGRSICMAKDGSRLAVGGSNGHYVQMFWYERNDKKYVEIGEKIHGALSTYFGWAVSLSDDGSRLIVGAPFDDTGGDKSGRAFIYNIEDDSWRLVGAVTGEASHDWSGTSVAISGDGTRVAIGAEWNDGGGYDSGHARVFEGLENM